MFNVEQADVFCNVPHEITELQKQQQNSTLQ